MRGMNGRESLFVCWLLRNSFIL